MTPAAKLIFLTGNAQSFDDMRAQMFANLRDTLPPGEFLDRYINAMDTAIGEVFTADTFIPITEKVLSERFSEPEIEEMISFFESPVGAKWVQTFPTVAMELQKEFHEVIQEKMPIAIEIADRLMDASKGA